MNKFPPQDAYRADTRKIGYKKQIPEHFYLSFKKYLSWKSPFSFDIYEIISSLG